MRVRARFGMEPWPFAIAALLAAMIGTSVGFLRIALANPDAVISADPFQDGIRYAANAAAEARGRALGLGLDVRTDPTETGLAVRVELRDASGAAVAPDRVRVRRERPAEGGFDVDVPVARANGGVAAQVALPRPGRWEIHVHAERGDAVVERRVALWR
ncbi:MAG: hypothetical protein DCC71_12710 [Proteobacteria bacterium]|nr:MAG: hypothetical protein DCC71_12710 [Pseudomonadota bacterium]